jgi:hypothetical protein
MAENEAEPVSDNAARMMINISTAVTGYLTRRHVSAATAAKN